MGVRDTQRDNEIRKRSTCDKLLFESGIMEESTTSDYNFLYMGISLRAARARLWHLPHGTGKNCTGRRRVSDYNPERGPSLCWPLVANSLRMDVQAEC